MGKGSLLSGQAKEYKGNQKHKPGCPKGKLASKLVSNTAITVLILSGESLAI